MSAGLLVYFVLKADPAQAAATIRNADPFLLALAILQLALQVPLLAWRWRLITSSLGGRMPYGAALRYSWIGTFAGQILPSIGGDAVRMWLYWTRQGSRRIAVYGVVLERLIMVVALLALVILSQSGLAARGVPVTVLGTASLLLACIAAATAAIFFFAKRMLKESHFLPIRALRHAAEDLNRLRTDLPRTSLALGLSFAAYLNMAIVMWMIGLGLDLGASLADCMVLAPLVVLAGMLPISFGGWGIREGAAILLFGLVGLSQAEAFALSAIFGLCSVAVTLPGSMLWVTLERAGEAARSQSAERDR